MHYQRAERAATRLSAEENEQIWATMEQAVEAYPAERHNAILVGALAHNYMREKPGKAAWLWFAEAKDAEGRREPGLGHKTIEALRSLSLLDSLTQEGEPSGATGLVMTWMPSEEVVSETSLFTILSLQPNLPSSLHSEGHSKVGRHDTQKQLHRYVGAVAQQMMEQSEMTLTLQVETETSVGTEEIVAYDNQGQRVGILCARADPRAWHGCTISIGGAVAYGQMLRVATDTSLLRSYS